VWKGLQLSEVKVVKADNEDVEWFMRRTFHHAVQYDDAVSYNQNAFYQMTLTIMDGYTVAGDHFL
jgi:hypothetical protein